VISIISEHIHSIPGITCHLKLLRILKKNKADYLKILGIYILNYTSLFE